MGKAKLFVENFLVYGLGGIISKIIPFIMLPIVTRLMPDSSYFGINDMSNTITSFASSFALMGMYDAMFRLFFEKDEIEYKKSVCSTALVFTLCTSFAIFFILLVFRNQIARWFFSDRKYAFLVYLSAIATLVGATNSIISAPTRMENKRKIFLVANTVSPVLSYAISIPLLLAGYYVIALPLAAVISGASMEATFSILNHRWFSVKRFDRGVLRQLLVIGIPLLPNFIIYWIFNSSDKLMVTNMLGVGATGLYSVGSKLGHLSQLIYTAFAGGWQYFAFSTMKEKNQVESNSIIFEYLGIISFIASFFVCAWSHAVYNLLFTEEYLESFVISPYLFLAPLLLMLFQVECNQFLVVKKTWPNMLILSLGAVLNIGLNYILIPVLGIEGAAVATLAGYIVSDFICTVVLIKMKLMVISAKFIVSVILTFVFFVAWRVLFCDKFLIGTFAALIASALLLLVYKKDLQSILGRIKSKLSADKNSIDKEVQN